MIHIDFDPNKLPAALKAEWDALQVGIEATTDALIFKWETTGKLTQRDLDDTIWRNINKWLKKHVFNGKCAYCETHLEGARQTGDAEHYRPKLKVNYKQAGKKTYTTPQVEYEPGQMLDHPGYFWLTYHWKNLLPSCKFCNANKGKKSQFPAAKSHVLSWRLEPADVAKLQEKPYKSAKHEGAYYLMPDDLDVMESPYLLHPYKDDPQNHLAFDDFGNVMPKDNAGQISPRGKHSIEVYNLGADELRTSRYKAQQDALVLYNMALGYLTRFRNLNLAEARQQILEEPPIKEILDGKAPYSAAQIAYLTLTHSL